MESCPFDVIRFSLVPSRMTETTAAERRWIDENVARARSLAEKYGGDTSLRALDVVWEAFSSRMRETGADPNALINMIGLAFGQRLVDDLGFEWAVVTDEGGTEIAVHRADGDVLVFPTVTVAKRWERNEGAFLVRLYEAMRADIP